MSDAPALEPMHLVADLDAADDFEKKHTPVIVLKAADAGMRRISVEVGRLVPHPNQPDHFIGWIAVLANGAEIARFDLAAVATAPRVSVTIAVDPGTTVRAVSSCNLHGLWASEVTA